MTDLSGFELVEKSPFGKPRSTEIAVTIKKNGLAISMEAVRQLNTRKVRLLRNAQSRQVAVVPAEEGEVSAYSLSKNGMIGCATIVADADMQEGRVMAEIQNGVLIFAYTKRPDMRPRARTATQPAHN